MGAPFAEPSFLPYPTASPNDSSARRLEMVVVNNMRLHYHVCEWREKKRTYRTGRRQPRANHESTRQVEEPF